MCSYYRGAVGALIVYDITKAITFKNVEKWLQEMHEHADKDIVIMLVGNKLDLKASREVATEDAKRFAQKNNLLYIETSALDGENIQLAFQQTINGKYNILLLCMLTLVSSAIYESKKQQRTAEEPRPSDNPTPSGGSKTVQLTTRTPQEQQEEKKKAEGGCKC